MVLNSFKLSYCNSFLQAINWLFQMPRSKKNFCTSWRELAFADSVFTNSLSSSGHKMRKITSSMWEKNERSIAMAQQMEKDLQQSLDFVEYKPLNSSFIRDNDSNFDSFGVFAKTNLEFGHVVPGVLGYLAHLPEEEVVENVNDFSVVWHKKASQIMLGPLSFLNSSCLPDSAFVPDVKRKMMELSVISKKGVKAGEEITVFYRGVYFGENRISCQCAHTEYHGSNERVYDFWTRSGKGRKTTILPPLTNSSASAECNFPLANEEPVKPELLSKRRRAVTKAVKSRVFKKFRRSRKLAPDSSSDCASSSTSSDNATTENSPADLFPLFSHAGGAIAPAFEANEGQSDEIEELKNFLTSTPEHNNTYSDFEEVENAPDFIDEFDSESADSNGSESDKIFVDSRLSVSSFSNRLIGIASDYSFSDRALRDVIKLFQEALPQANNVTSFHFVQKFSNNISCEMPKNEFTNGVVFFFDIKHQLEHVLEQNFDVLRQSVYWFPHSDFKF